MIALFIGAAFALAADALFVAGLVWQAGLAFVVAIGIMTFAIQKPFSDSPSLPGLIAQNDCPRSPAAAGIERPS